RQGTRGGDDRDRIVGAAGGLRGDRDALYPRFPAHRRREDLHRCPRGTVRGVPPRPRLPRVSPLEQPARLPAMRTLSCILEGGPARQGPRNGDRLTTREDLGDWLRRTGA